MTIRKMVMAGGALLVAGLLAFLAVSESALYRLKVNGPLYDQIASSKDLIADILPPPQYIIEPYLEATLALQNPASVEVRAKRLDILRTEYDVRHSFWLKQSLDPVLQQGLTAKSYEPAKKFWATLYRSFLPALQRNDMSAAQAAYGELSAAYNEHRARVEELVTASNAKVAEIEAIAAAESESTVLSVWISSLLMLGLLLGAIYGLITKVIAPINGMTNSMSQLAKGNLATDIPHLSRKDEIGGMAHALVVFKEALVAKKHAEDQSAAEARSKAHRELREMEDWIAREKPSFEEVAKKALELRRRYLNSEGPVAGSPNAS